MGSQAIHVASAGKLAAGPVDEKRNTMPIIVIRCLPAPHARVEPAGVGRAVVRHEDENRVFLKSGLL